MDSKSLLLVCKKDLLRTLITMDIDKSKLFFVGSCGDKDSLIRFCKIYKPKVILFVVQDESRKEIFDLISVAKEVSYKSSITVVDERLKLYHTGLYMRYGAQAVYDKITDVNSIVDEVIKKAEANTKYNITPVIKTKKSDTTEFRCIHLPTLYQYMIYLPDYRLLRAYGFVDYVNKAFPGICVRRYIRSHHDKFVKLGLLPKNKWLLTCYPLIFPEKFNRLRHRMDKKNHFVYSISNDVRKYIQKHSKKQKKTHFLGENMIKLSGLDYKRDPISSQLGGNQNDEK